VKVNQQVINDLRVSFFAFRDKAEEITRLLPQNLKGLTIHDMRHIDALWQTCDVIGGDNLLKNPLEGYVLGGAFLIHDLGLALASYPGGTEDLFDSKVKPEQMSDLAIDQRLRLEHAKHAKKLATIAYDGRYLIENENLRESLGHLIGTIAYSHWQSTDELDESEEFATEKGAPATGGYPHEWQIDGRKLAYLLRTCDACHIDGVRAPSLAMSLRKPEGVAKKHWQAQKKIQKAYSKNGRLVFTSKAPFASEERDAWWTFYELAQIADKELRSGEEYFSSNGLSLAVNRIAGISSPRQFSKYVRTEDWIPIDTRPRVTDAQGLIERLGGSALYGKDCKVPLRELIQNARDSIACRRSLEIRDPSWGEIIVSIDRKKESSTLIVSDNGKGISEKGFEYLLDFGAQYWMSTLCKEENPRIETSTFKPVGLFGIGFFSVFMISRNVKIITRRPNDSKHQTRVMEFTNGIADRPILRQAREEEMRCDSGTQVILEITHEDEENVLRPTSDSADRSFGQKPIQIRDSWSLRELLEWLCPTLDTNLVATNPDGSYDIAVNANDWKTLEIDALVERLMSHRKLPHGFFNHPGAPNIIKRISPVSSTGGEDVLARIAINGISGSLFADYDIPFVNSCGGFRAGHSIFPGVTTCEAKTASRQESNAFFKNDPAAMSIWSTSQADMISRDFDISLEKKVELAACVRACNGQLGDLPVVLHLGDYITSKEFSHRIENRSEVIISDELLLTPSINGEPALRVFNWHSIKQSAEQSVELLARKDVFYVPTGRTHFGRPLGIMQDPDRRGFHPAWERFWYSLWGVAFEVIANGWGCPIDSLLSSSDILQKDAIGTRSIDILRRPQ